MSNLSDNDKFQVLHGWKPGSVDSITRTFDVALNGAVPEALPIGSLVALNASGEILPAATNTTFKPVYLVIEGNVVDTNTRSYADTTHRVSVARGSMTVRTGRYNPAGTYAVNTELTYSAGLLTDRTAPTEQLVGYVTAFDATAETLTAELTL